MNSSEPELRGRQEPRILQIPERSGTRAEDLFDLCDVVGVENDPWQEISLDAILSVDQFDHWACTEFGELVPRQNGKGNILLSYSLGHLLLWPRPDGQPKLICHTAHEVKTAQEAFIRLERVFRSSPLLMSQLKGGERGIRKAHGEMGFELENGTRLRYIARSKSSGVGFTCDTLIIDEAQEMSLDSLDALLPTMSNVPNPQILYTGTVPAEINDYEVWKGVRDRGRGGNDSRTGWIEYSPPGSSDPEDAEKIDKYDPENWVWSNPGLNLRFLRTATIEDEVGRLSDDSFRRLRLSVWPDDPPELAVSANDLDMTVWEENRNGSRLKQSHGDLLTLSVAVADNSGYASIAGASLVGEDRIFVEHLATQGQTRWVAKELRELIDSLGAVSVVLDEKKCSMILADLKREHIKWLAMKPGEIAAAHSLIIEYVNAGNVEHRGQPELTDSLRLASPRAVGAYGSTWEQSDEAEPATPAQAVTQAHWGVKNYQANPPKKGLVRGFA